MRDPNSKHVFFAEVERTHVHSKREELLRNPQTGELESYLCRSEVSLDVRADNGRRVQSLPGPLLYANTRAARENLKVRVTVEADWYGDTEKPEYLEVYRRNPVVCSVLRHGGTLEDVIVQLDRINREQQEKLMDLHGLTPRIYITPEGKRMRWDCPDELIPVTDLRKEI